MTTPLPRHDGTIALVTGANKGIGREVARQLAASGMTVLLGARSAERGQAAVAELIADGAGDVRFLHLDVTDEATVQAAAEAVERDFDGLHVLVNNAGISGIRSVTHPSIADVTASDVRRAYETNVVGVIAVTQALLGPLCRARGRVVNMSSALGSFARVTGANGGAPSPHLLLPYSSAKAALNMVTVLYAKALSEAGVSVNAVSPGYVATDLNNQAGTRTVAEGARIVVDLATRPAGELPTGAFLSDSGDLPW